MSNGSDQEERQAGRGDPAGHVAAEADILERLRDEATQWPPSGNIRRLLDEAAAEITALRALVVKAVSNDAAACLSAKHNGTHMQKQDRELVAWLRAQQQLFGTASYRAKTDRRPGKAADRLEFLALRCAALEGALRGIRSKCAAFAKPCAAACGTPADGPAARERDAPAGNMNNEQGMPADDSAEGKT